MAGRHSASGGTGDSPQPARRARPAREARSARPRRRVLTGVVVALLVAGTASYFAFKPGDDATTAGQAAATKTPCTGNLNVPVVVSAELLPAVQALANKWTASKPSVDGACAQAAVTVQDPSSVVSELASAAAPTVWLPDSTTWSSKLTAVRPSLVTQVGSAGTSPLVVAAAAGSSAALGSEAAAGWKGVLSGSVPISIADPRTSGAGALITTTAASQAGTEPGAQAQVVGLFMRMQTAPLTSPTDGFASFKANPSTARSFVTSEQQVYAANQQAGTVLAKAIYPAGPAVLLDYPILTVASTNPSPSGAAGAAAFAKTLTSAAARLQFAQLGLRDEQAAPLAGAATLLGVESPVVEAAPAPPEQLQALSGRLWQAALKPSHMLSVIDVSGSMNDPAVPGGSSKIVIASKATQVATSVVPPSWTVGLWVFSTKAPPANPWTELVPLGIVGRNRPQLLAADRALPQQTGGNTALYATVLAAFADSSRHYDPKAVNVVALLTDGSNVDPNSSITLADVLATLKTQYNPAKPVRIVTIGFGHDADTAALKKISDATGGQSYQVNDPSQIGGVLLDAIVANNT
ncbi:von Willebrand factor type A domain-containing protein [Jatrophihabitans sp. GAS493]|uniref:VWA domain-containing protein n=1 Tax=Jatrophihabitans sp. GAS493 TaxID=1907575 RepID=UPI000BB69840|nr:VWA domain-containing protein [Jatrophihabitans sp. GAS493]SOD71020.1 von Willebrand factor type A domain-containing protein [Jatrophihabitans sp. GAS493]